jgi:hypothetical protein
LPGGDDRLRGLFVVQAVQGDPGVGVALVERLPFFIKAL